MKINNFTFLLLAFACLFSQTKAQNVVTKTYDLSGGTFMNIPIPEYTKWYFFSFVTGDTIGSYTVEVADGTEVINETWKNRTDWDIAFHATDFRTNSGTSGVGNGGAIRIDSTATAVSSFENLTTPPESGYVVDAVSSTTTIFGMTGMPPLMGTTSVNEQAKGWATFGMSGGSVKPTALAIKTANGSYAKLLLKEFYNAEENPGYITFDYVYPLNGSASVEFPSTAEVNIYPNPASDYIKVDLSSLEGNATINIYNASGILVKTVKSVSSNETIGIAELDLGLYLVQIYLNNKQISTQKIQVK